VTGLRAGIWPRGSGQTRLAGRLPMPPLLLEKAGGAALYATTDLATIGQRTGGMGAQRITYAVDQRQSLHFEQVFRAARKAGIGHWGLAGPRASRRSGDRLFGYVFDVDHLVSFERQPASYPTKPPGSHRANRPLPGWHLHPQGERAFRGAREPDGRSFFLPERRPVDLLKCRAPPSCPLSHDSGSWKRDLLALLKTGRVATSQPIVDDPFGTQSIQTGDTGYGTG